MADDWSNSYERVITRAMGQEIGDSAFAESVVLDRIWGKRIHKTGTQIEQPIITGEDGTATMFAIHGFEHSGTASNVTFAEPNKLINLVIPWKYAGDTIRISEMRLKQAKGDKTVLYDYFKSQAQLFKLSMQKLLGNQAVNGNPETSGGTTTDLSGLKAIFDVAAGNTHTAYMSQDRTQSDAMYPSIFVASSTGSAYSTGTVTGTAGTRVLTVSGGTFSGNVNAGDKITTGGVTYTIRAVVNTTTIHVTPKLAAAASGATFSSAAAFNDTALYGTGNGNLTLAKLDRAYYDCVDGNDAPTLMLAKADIFGHIATLLAANQRYLGTKVEYNGTSGRKSQSIAYNSADLIADNYMASGTVFGINEKYLNAYALSGADTFALAEGSLVRDYSTYERASLVAQVNLALNIATRAPNRNFKIAGFLGY